jgi:hypothetical protein
MDRIEQGRRIVVEYNEDQLYEEMFIRFVIRYGAGLGGPKTRKT